jgi:hypothetical protein
VTGSNPGQASPGWYPTSSGSAQLRWWDGSQWTEHYQTLGVAPLSPLSAPAGTKPNTPWIWVFALLPLLQFAEFPFLVSDLSNQVISAGTATSSASTPAALSSISGSLAIDAVSLVLYGIWAVVAWLDYRTLNSRRVPVPFHWAWTFLSPIVYIIGRTVVVRRRTGGGLAPLWIYIALIVIYIVATFVVIIPIVNAAVNTAINNAG